MIFDFNPWQLDVDIDLTKQLYKVTILFIIKHLILSLLKVYRQSNKCFLILWGLTSLK